MMTCKVGSPASFGSSVGSVTSKLLNLAIEDEKEESVEIAPITPVNDQSIDAQRWQYVKGNLYKQLGYTSPLKLQAAIDAQRLQQVPEEKIPGSIDIPRGKSV